MKGTLIIALGIFLLTIADTALADMPGGGIRWASQTIWVSKLSSLDKYVLYIPYEDAEGFANYWQQGRPIPGMSDRRPYSYDLAITRDSTFFFPEHGGSPTRPLRLFAVFQNRSTDTIKVGGNIEISFSGVKNNRLQYSIRKVNEKTKLTGVTGKQNRTGISEVIFRSGRTEYQLLIIMALTGLFGLIGLFKAQQRHTHKKVTL